MSTNFTIEGDSLEDAIRRLIEDAAGGDVDITLRTRGYDPRRTGPTTISATIGEQEVGDDRSSDDSSAEPAPRSRPRADRRDVEEAPTLEELEDEADIAADFVEGFLDALQTPGDLKITVLDDAIDIEIVETDSGTLIGRRGQTLEALQELARCSMQRELQRRTRVRLDVEGYRTRRIEKILDKADEAIDEALDTGNSVKLEPMDVVERKAVHELVSQVDGVVSRSTGREPGRRVVIEPGD